MKNNREGIVKDAWLRGGAQHFSLIHQRNIKISAWKEIINAGNYFKEMVKAYFVGTLTRGEYRGDDGGTAIMYRK